MSQSKFDFIVIGGGSAGYTAAAEAAQHGLRTAVVEDAPQLGGLCILRGCMPSKALIASANRYQAVAKAKELGIETTAPTFHPRSVIARKQRLVERFARARREEIASGGFTLIRGRAKYLDEHTISVSARHDEAGQRFTAGAFLIATGSVILTPDIPGLAEIGYLTSDSILEDTRPTPKSVIVLGDGPVGLEAAHYYSGIGSHVTIVSKHGQILESADHDVAEALAGAFRRRGVKIITHAAIESAASSKGRKEIRFRVKGRLRAIVAEEVVFALGRKPNVTGLGLDAAGINVAESGHVTASLYQRTNRAHIFAAGDVCGPFEILHLAVQQGRVAARNAARARGRLKGRDEAMDYRLKLTGLFTDPEVAVVGLTEKKAREDKVRIRVARVPFSEVGRAQVENEAEGFAKLLCDPKTGKLLGAAIVGPRAVELIHEMVAVLAFGGTVMGISALPHYHPTLSEIWTFPAERLSAKVRG